MVNPFGACRWPHRVLAALGVLLLTGCTTPAPDASPPATSPPPTITRGVSSISFDDGTIGHFSYARPALAERDLAATFYLVSDAMNWGPTTMNSDQARQMVSDGHEIGNHTRDHHDLATLTPEQVRAEFSDAQNAIESLVGVRPATCAYPYGSRNTTVRLEAGKQFRACRSTQGGLNDKSGLVTDDLVSYYVRRGTTAPQIRAAAQAAQKSNKWVIFVYHGVDPALKGADDVTPTSFSAHLDALVSTGIPVLTVDQALTAMTQ